MGVTILQTIIAIILAIVSCVIISMLVYTAIFLTQRVFTETRPEWISIGANIFGSVAGVNAARWSCNKTLRRYSSRAVFFAFAAVSVFIMVSEFFLTPFNFGQVSIYAGAIATLITAHVLFWQAEGVEHERSEAPLGVRNIQGSAK